MLSICKQDVNNYVNNTITLQQLVNITLEKNNMQVNEENFTILYGLLKNMERWC